MNGDLRTRCLRTGLMVTEWLRTRRRPFLADELAEHLECGRRTAYRWLQAAEVAGLVDVEVVHARKYVYRAREPAA